MRLLQVSLRNAASERIQQILSGNANNFLNKTDNKSSFDLNVKGILRNVDFFFPDPKSIETAPGRVFPACMVLHQWDWYEYGSQGKVQFLFHLKF